MLGHYTVDESLKRQSSFRRDGWSPNFITPQPKAPTLPGRRPRFDAKQMRRRVDQIVEHFEGRTDANETAFFARQLLYIMPQPYDYKYPEIRYQSVLPVTYQVPTGAKTHAFHQFDEMGKAEIVDDYGDDAPNVERRGFEVIGKIYPVRSSYSYSIQDLRSAMFAGTPLDAMKAITARRIIERKCDKLAAVGDTTRSMYGIANDPNIIQVTASTKAAGGTKWVLVSGSSFTVNATPSEILADINSMYIAIRNTSKGVFEPDSLILGTNTHSVLSTLRLDQFNMRTVFEYLMNALPWLKAIEWWPRLDTAGAGTAERILMRNSNRENFELVVPQDFEQFPPQPRNLAFDIQCHKRWGEPQMRQPKHCSYMDGCS